MTFDFLAGELLLVDKPLDWTSFDVVNKIRFRFKKATKTLEGYQGLGKTYTGTVTLGATTPSYDTESEVDQTFPIDHIDDLLLDKTREQFIGALEQYPPIFSAIKKDGVRAYHKARKGQKVELKARPIEIYEFDFTFVDLPKVGFQVACSKGTYIRSLAHDFGKLLGSGGYLSELRRTQIGKHLVSDAWQLEDLMEAIENS